MKTRPISEIDFASQQWFHNAVKDTFFIKRGLGVRYLLLHKVQSVNRFSGLVYIDKPNSYSRHLAYGYVQTSRGSGGLTGSSTDSNILLFEVEYQGVKYAALRLNVEIATAEVFILPFVSEGGVFTDADGSSLSSVRSL